MNSQDNLHNVQPQNYTNLNQGINSPQPQNYASNSDRESESKMLNEIGNPKIMVAVLTLLLIGALLYIFVFNKKQYAVVFIDGDNITVKNVKSGKQVEDVNVNPGFDSWYYYNGEKCDIKTLKVTDNVVLVARYFNTHTVSFNTNGGTEVKSQTIYGEEHVTRPNNPTKDGYIFKEWQLDNKTYNFDTSVSQDITLVAVWEKLEATDVTYVVTFDTDGGSSISPLTVKENGTVKVTNPTKDGYTFKEWQLDNKKYDLNTKVTKDITLKAIWAVKEKITITFDSNGGTAISSIEAYAGDKVNLPNPTKANYVFGGWYSGTTKYTSSTAIKSSVTLTAKWLTQDEVNLEKAKSAIQSSYNITKGGQVIAPTSSGCTITHSNASSISTITRKTSDTKVTLNFDITCGSATGTATSTGIIKASTLKYTAEPSGNMTNYDLTIVDSTRNGSLYAVSGSYLSDIVNGVAHPNNSDVESFPKFRVIFADDKNTTYEVVKK